MERGLSLAMFLTAILGYAGLSLTVLRSARGEVPVVLLRLTALIIAVHVALVWTFRYHGDLAAATRGGYAPFLVFHAALAMIAAAAVVGGRARLALVRLAFAIATLGALGAVFRRPEVAVYRAPVIACAALGMVGLVAAFRKSPGGCSVGTGRAVAGSKEWAGGE